MSSPTAGRLTLQDHHVSAAASPRYAEPEALPVCYDGQITERLRLAAELQDDIRHYEPPEGVDVQIYRQFCFSQLHLSILLCMGLEELEELVEYPPPFDLLLSFWSVDALLVSFLDRGTDEEPAGSRASRCGQADPDGDYDPPTRGSDETVVRSRQPQMRNKALERDGYRCVMTQQPDPVVYPIWPLSATRSMRACRRLQYSAVATGHHLRSRLYQILVPGSASDLTCNLVSLCADLARHWGKAHFGLKWYSSLATGAGDGLSTVLLEFHWLPESISRAVDGCLVSSDDRGKDEARRRVSLDDVEGLAESLRGTLLSASRVSCRGAARDCHGRPWESGRLLEVRMAAGDVEDFKTLIEGQWLMVRIAALSGAAEDVERFGDGLPLAP